MDFEGIFSAPHISRVAFFLYFRKQMKAAPLKGKQMKGLRIEEKAGFGSAVAPVDIAPQMRSTSGQVCPGYQRTPEGLDLCSELKGSGTA